MVAKKTTKTRRPAKPVLPDREHVDTKVAVRIDWLTDGSVVVRIPASSVAQLERMMGPEIGAFLRARAPTFLREVERGPR